MNELINNNLPEVLAIRDIFYNCDKSRNGLEAIEAWVNSMSAAYKECPYEIFHSFADGMYTREIHIKAGDIIVGKIHKKEYFINMLKGKGWIISEHGCKEVIAPCRFTAKAGAKHIGFFVENTVWTDTSRTEATNIEDAEKDIFADSYEELDEYMNTIDTHSDRGLLCQAG